MSAPKCRVCARPATHYVPEPTDANRPAAPQTEEARGAGGPRRMHYCPLHAPLDATAIDPADTGPGGGRGEL